MTFSSKEINFPVFFTRGSYKERIPKKCTTLKILSFLLQLQLCQYRKLFRNIDTLHFDIWNTCGGTKYLPSNTLPTKEQGLTGRKSVHPIFQLHWMKWSYSSSSGHQMANLSHWERHQLSHSLSQTTSWYYVFCCNSLSK